MGIGAQKLVTIESHPARLREDAQQPDMIAAIPLRHCALRPTTGCHGRPPPSEEVFRAELLRQVGSVRGLEEFTLGGRNGGDPDVVDVVTDPDARSYHYALKVLRDFGGEIQGRPARSPWFVTRPWKEWPWWRRGGFRVLELVGVLLFVPTVLVLELVRAVRRARAR